MKTEHPLRSILLFILLMLTALPLQADHLIMVRAHQPLPAALDSLKQTIQQQGYTVARVDMVNIGLLGMGYTSNKYRAVFFGKADEIEELSRKYPQLTPYLPLRIAIFAEGDSTLLVTINPSTYHEFLAARKPAEIFNRWEKDIEEIFSRMAERPGQAQQASGGK